MRRWLPAAGLILFCSLLFFPALADRDLTSSHEARAAQNAQMMLDEGHWLVPRLFDRHLELQKPPLYYWLVAFFGWLNGGVVNAWAVRLPAALAAMMTVLFLNYLGCRIGRPLAGFLAATILASCVHFTWLARVGRIDMPITMTITVALGAFYLGSRRWQALGYTAIGFGLLLKGPIALILPAVVISTAWLLNRLRPPNPPLATHHSPLTTSLRWGIPLTLAIAAPWYVWANIQTDNQLFEVFFWYHNVERGLGGSETLATHPWWFYGPRAVIDLLPWSLVAPIGVYLFLRKPEFREDDAARLGMIWFVSILIFLTCMRFKRADYLLPGYPGLAIFLGAVIEKAWQTQPAFSLCQWRKALATSLATLFLVYACGWLSYAFVFAPDRDHPLRAMAAEIRKQTSGPVVFFRAESHLLAYHVGRPAPTVLEWENLEIWAAKPRRVYYVMPESCVEEWRRNWQHIALEPVLHSADFNVGPNDRPLVVMRSDGRLTSN